MSYIFRIYESNQGDNSDKLGWISVNDGYSDGVISGRIKDENASGKIGTSIPTPLARLYLFNTAFNIANIEKSGNISDSYKELVSDCLDLLQFLYEKGKSRDLEIIEWNINTEIPKLLQSKKQEHQLLAQSLNIAFGQTSVENGPKTPFSALTKIFIFKYKYVKNDRKEEIILGGTSPFTMVFTSPNLKREIAENEITNLFTDNEGNRLFASNSRYYRMIDGRGEEFKRYLWRYRYQFLKENYIEKVLNSNPPFRTFLKDNLEEYYDGYTENGVKIRDEERPHFDKYYATIQYQDVVPVIYDGMPLFYDNAPVTINGSEFILKDCSDRYKQIPGYGDFGAPLALCKGTHGYNYLKAGQPWDSKTIVIDPKNTPLPKRMLPAPGTASDSELNYPFVTIGDFLEEILVEIGYEIDSKHFFSITLNGKYYLLPVKKDFFIFYSRDQLKKMLETKYDERENSVSVTLNIPISGGTLPFKREYKKDTSYPIINLAGEEAGFGMAVSPFYKLDSEGGNCIYDVQLYVKPANQVKDICLSFYDIDKLAMGEDTETKRVERTEYNKNHSYYYSLNKPFDLIVANFIINNSGSEVSHSVLIIPEFEKKGFGGKDFIFGIDFGTSNTHIAYTNDDGQTINSFRISEEAKERQVVTLHTKPDKTGDFQWFYREFVPVDATYPIKTATLEKRGFKVVSGQNLFSQINIGYLIEGEKFALNDCYNYETDLKWACQNDVTNDVAKKRIKAFCDQTILAIRNKMVLNEGNPSTIKLVCFFPNNMMDDPKKIFKDAWIDSVKRILEDFNVIKEFSENGCLKEEYEDVVPYYALVKNQTIQSTQNTLNIDIGGGTTDIFYYANEMKRGFRMSALFAGNDIWGDGVLGLHHKENGFMLLGKDEIEKRKPRIEEMTYNRYLDYYKFTKNSHDLVSFFFKYDDAFGFSDIIRSNIGLRTLLLIHYSSIIYYICNVLKKKNISVPSAITFTGKGSEYIKLISTDNSTITNLTRSLFCAFMGQESNSVSVKFVDRPKELTAEGGVLRYCTSYSQVVFDKNNENCEEISVSGTKTDSKNEYKHGDVTVLNTELMKDVLDNFENFITLLFNTKEIKSSLVRTFNFSETDTINIRQIMKSAEQSYKESCNWYQAQHKKEASVLIEDSKETLFFLTLKDAIFQLSRDVAKEIIKR